MEAQEIRMRCLEAAQTATKAHGSVAPADAIVRVAREFEAYVVGEPEKPAKATAKKAAAE